MTDRRVPPWQWPGAARRERAEWRFWLILLWVCLSLWMLHSKAVAIGQFGLGDTDDNLRYLQVRDWLAGQGWFDLRQHRLGPPMGANIHWSRLVDLPIAALFFAAWPFMSTVKAWTVAVALEPLIPLGVLLVALAVLARRMVGRWLWALVPLVLIASPNAMAMFMPLRIDHHNWQLALLAWAVVGLVDPKPGRGGVTSGIATALSLNIGLEFVHLMLLIAALNVADWASGTGSARRLIRHGLAMAAGCLLLWPAFASVANRGAVCDALSPVWLYVTTLGGGAMALLGARVAGAPVRRWAAAGMAAIIIGALFPLLFPQCLGSPEGLTPELRALWFSNVREVKSILTRDWQQIVTIMAMPVAGLIGAIIAWTTELDDRRARRWQLLMILSAVSVAMVVWQMRTAAAAQVIGTTGAVALLAALAGWAQRRRSAVARVAASWAIVAVALGLGSDVFSRLTPAATPSTQSRFLNKVAQSDRACQSAQFLRTLDAVPAGLMFTHVDFGPRLIAMTHHSAIAGPYHRNGPAIIDVMRAFRSDELDAHRIIARWRADYVLLCPDMPEATIYATKAPNGFYRQLMQGRVPGWLRPLTLPAGSPYRLYRVAKLPPPPAPVEEARLPA